MKEKKPTLNEWRRLYDLMEEVKEVAPWEYMEEDDVFGVQNPETSQIGFISVMGSLGEHLSIAVYLGPKALYQFWAVHEQRVDPMMILETPQLQASFEDREQLTKEDRRVMKKLKRRFRGRQDWPQFRSYRPGYAPWTLTQEEARFLIHALEQGLDVCKRLEEDETLLDPSDDVTYLVRTPSVQDDELVWRDQMLQIEPPIEEDAEITIPMQLVEDIRALPQAAGYLEVDLFLLPTPIQEEKGKRPFFPYSLLLVDGEEGLIQNTATLTPEPSLDEMWKTIPTIMAELLADQAERPSTIVAMSPQLYDYLTPLCEAIGIEMHLMPQLPALEEAKMSLLSYLQSGELPF